MHLLILIALVLFIWSMRGEAMALVGCLAMLAMAALAVVLAFVAVAHRDTVAPVVFYALMALGVVELIIEGIKKLRA